MPCIALCHNTVCILFSAYTDCFVELHFLNWFVNSMLQPFSIQIKHDKSISAFENDLTYEDVKL